MAFFVPIGLGIAEAISLAAESAVAVGIAAEAAGVATEAAAVGVGEAAAIGAGEAAAIGAGEAAAIGAETTAAGEIAAAAGAEVAGVDAIAGSGEAGLIAGTGETASGIDVSANVASEAVQTFEAEAQAIQFPEAENVGINAQGFVDELEEEAELIGERGARGARVPKAELGKGIRASMTAEQDAIAAKEDFVSLLREQFDKGPEEWEKFLEETGQTDRRSLFRQLLNEEPLLPEQEEALAQQLRGRQLGRAVRGAREARAALGDPFGIEDAFPLAPEEISEAAQVGELVQPAEEAAEALAEGARAPEVPAAVQEIIEPARGARTLITQDMLENLDLTLEQEAEAITQIEGESLIDTIAVEQDIDFQIDTIFQNIAREPITPAETFGDGVEGLEFFDTAGIVTLGSAAAIAAGLTGGALAAANMRPTEEVVSPEATQLVGSIYQPPTAVTMTDLRREHAASTYTLVDGGDVPPNMINPSFYTRIGGLDALTPIATTPNMMKSSGVMKTMAVNRVAPQSIAKKSLNNVSSSAANKKVVKQLQSMNQTGDLCECKPKAPPKTVKEKKEDKKKREQKKRKEEKCVENKEVLKAVQKGVKNVTSIKDVVFMASKLKRSAGSIKAKSVLKDANKIVKDLAKVEKLAKVNLKSKDAKKVINAASKAADVVSEAKRIKRKVSELKLNKELRAKAERILKESMKLKDNIKDAVDVAKEAVEIIDI